MTTAIEFLKKKRHNPLSDEEFWDWDIDLMTPKEVKALFIEFEQLKNSESPRGEAAPSKCPNCNHTLKIEL